MFLSPAEALLLLAHMLIETCTCCKPGIHGKNAIQCRYAGEAEFTLRELVTARGNRLQLPLQDGALDANCTLIAQDCSALNSEVRSSTVYSAVALQRDWCLMQQATCIT